MSSLDGGRWPSLLLFLLVHAVDQDVGACAMPIHVENQPGTRVCLAPAQRAVRYELVRRDGVVEQPIVPDVVCEPVAEILVGVDLGPGRGCAVSASVSRVGG